MVEQIRRHFSGDLGTGVQQVEHTGQHLDNIARLAASVEHQVREIARGAEIIANSSTACFMPSGQSRSDLAISDQQTQRLAQEVLQWC